MHQFIITFLCFFLSGFSVFAQYTETINSNRPGKSQGAFGVGYRVIQMELGVDFGQDEHALRRTKSNLFGIDYNIRYGLSTERVELSLSGRYLRTSKTWEIGASEETLKYSNFKFNTLGLKYLLYDPYKLRSLEDPNIRSWDANFEPRWRDLIPAVSLYAGVNVLFGDNPYMLPEESHISPKLAIITQHNYLNWVFVMNFIADKVATKNPVYSAIFTLTHSFMRKYSVFAEYQLINNDFYSDDLFRAGGAYLINDDLQVDIFGLVNFKDTPFRWNAGVGVTYRVDAFHKDHYVIPKEEKPQLKEVKKPNTDLFQTIPADSTGTTNNPETFNEDLIKKQYGIFTEENTTSASKNKTTRWETVPKNAKKEPKKPTKERVEKTTWGVQPKSTQKTTPKASKKEDPSAAKKKEKASSTKPAKAKEAKKKKD